MPLWPIYLLCDSGFLSFLRAVWALESKYKEDFVSFCRVDSGLFTQISFLWVSRLEFGAAGQPHSADGANCEPRKTATPRTTDEENTPWIFSKDSWNWYSYSAAGKSISQQSGDLDLELFCIEHHLRFQCGIQRYCRKIAWAYSHYRGIQRAETVFTLNPSLNKSNCSTNASINRTGLSCPIESSNELIYICNLGMPVAWFIMYKNTHCN